MLEIYPHLFGILSTVAAFVDSLKLITSTHKVFMLYVISTFLAVSYSLFILFQIYNTVGPELSMLMFSTKMPDSAQSMDK